MLYRGDNFPLLASYWCPFVTLEGRSFHQGGISNLDKTVDKVTNNDIIATPSSQAHHCNIKAEAEIGEVSASSIHIQYLLTWLAADSEVAVRSQ